MFKLDIDFGDLGRMTADFQKTIEDAAKEALKNLALQTHAHIIELTEQKLKTRRKPYQQALKPAELEQDGSWVIALQKSAMWIEEGLPSNFDMLDGLLKSPKAKYTKDGSGAKYIVVPFDQGKLPQQQTPEQQGLNKLVRKELKDRKIPYAKLERDDSGRPKLGLLHKVWTGKGGDQPPAGSPVGKVSGIPYLKGIAIYQKELKDKKGNTFVKRDVMTFRVASSKHKGERWIHPGLEASHFFEEAEQWAQKQWDDKIGKELVITLDQML